MYVSEKFLRNISLLVANMLVGKCFSFQKYLSQLGILMLLSCPSISFISTVGITLQLLPIHQSNRSILSAYFCFYWKMDCTLYYYLLLRNTSLTMMHIIFFDLASMYVNVFKIYLFLLFFLIELLKCFPIRLDYQNECFPAFQISRGHPLFDCMKVIMLGS